MLLIIKERWLYIRFDSEPVSPRLDCIQSFWQYQPGQSKCHLSDPVSIQELISFDSIFSHQEWPNTFAKEAILIGQGIKNGRHRWWCLPVFGKISSVVVDSEKVFFSFISELYFWKRHYIIQQLSLLYLDSLIFSSLTENSVKWAPKTDLETRPKKNLQKFPQIPPAAR